MKSKIKFAFLEPLGRTAADCFVRHDTKLKINPKAASLLAGQDGVVERFLLRRVGGDRPVLGRVDDVLQQLMSPCFGHSRDQNASVQTTIELNV